MLIKLKSNTSGEIIMFAKDARQLFEIIGKECTARGVFVTEQLPPAISSLQRAVDEEKLAARLQADESRSSDAHGKHPHEEGDEDVEEKPEARIGLAQRARPLITLMQWTVKDRGFILWEADQDF
jgi:hypothetical protein